MNLTNVWVLFNQRNLVPMKIKPSTVFLYFGNSNRTCDDFISVQVLQSDGGNYCASVNAATLAVIDAGIPMKDFVCACSASYINDTSVVDINYLEESSGGPEIIVAVLPKSEQIVFLEMNGRLHEDNLSKVIDMAVKGCKDVYGMLDRTVRDNVSEAAASHGWDVLIV